MLFALALVAAACGDDDVDDVSVGDADDELTETPGGDDDTIVTEPDETDETDETDEPDEAEAVGSVGEGCEVDDSIDATHGEGAGWALAAFRCAGENPLEPEGEPVTIGLMNHEGDPAGTFPELTMAAEAAVEYINEELGGFGSDPVNGIPGRPLEFEVCAMAVNPADSQRCANELAAADPLMVLSGLNFFGNHFPILQAAGVPVVVAVPITIGDFTSPDVFAIGGGGGCLGVHTGLVEFATNDLEGRRIAVPWADTPPGVTCYYDLEAKPLDVLKGVVEGSSERAGSIPELEHIGVPIQPATPDVTSQVTQVLDFEPDAIIFSAQGSDCWNFVDTMGRLGWTPDSTPLALSTSCLDFEAIEAAGDLADGIYFVGSASTQLNDPATIDDARRAFEAEQYQTQAAEYGLPQGELTKTFATSGWNAMMNLWVASSRVVRDGGELTPEAMQAEFAGQEDAYLYGSTPSNCANSPTPYTAVCNFSATALQWNGESLDVVRDTFTGTDLVEGTEIIPGPS